VLLQNLSITIINSLRGWEEVTTFYRLPAIEKIIFGGDSVK